MTSPKTATQPNPAADFASSIRISRQRRNCIFLAIALAMLVSALGATSVATALPTIVADLGNPKHQSWVVTAYLLGATAVTAVVGKLGDLFGRRAVFQHALVTFTIGSVLCGLSETMTVLTISRAVEGAGAGGMSVTASALVGEVVPLRYRGSYQGILGAMFGFGTVTGPLVGGFLTDHFGWQWVFWSNVPLAVVVMVVAATAIPKLAERPKPVFDYLGILLIALGTTGLILATSWGGTTYAWSSAPIIGLFVGSATLLGAFTWVESHATEPILPLRLFHSRTVAVCCALSFVVGFAMLGALAFLPTFMRYVGGANATGSGLRTLPMVIGILIASTGSGVLVGRTGRYKVFPVVGTAAMALGFVLLSTVDASTSVLLQSSYLIVLGTGIGLSMQMLVLIVQNNSSFEDLGVATSAVTFFRAVGSAFGAATFGALFANFLIRREGPALAASGAPHKAMSSANVLHRLPHDVAAPIVRAYTESLTQVFLCAAAVAAGGFVVALLLREVPLKDIHGVAGDLGDGFGMPTVQTPEKLLEIAIGHVLRHAPGVRLRTLATQPDSELDVAGLWGVLRIYQYGRLFGTARLTHIAKYLHVPREVIESTFDRLVQSGYATRDGDQLCLTESGLRQIEALAALIVGWIADHLTQSPGFEEQPDHHEMDAALEGLAYRILAQRDWFEDLPELGTVAASN